MLPSLFIAHGAPTIVIEDSPYTQFLRQLPQQFPKPKAIILFTAHWESTIQLISGVEKYDMIYDFGGFPDEMYQMTYPAPGNPSLAGKIHELLLQEGIESEIDRKRGMDHGVWTILKLLYPEADIPVVAMSVNPYESPEKLYAIGRALSSLRGEEVMIIGSGGTVHNLRRLIWDGSGHSADWAVGFDDWLAEQLEKWQLQELFQYETKAPHARDAVPRNEHFIPLLPAMGAADDSRRAKLLFRGYQYGSLSLCVWQFS